MKLFYSSIVASLLLVGAARAENWPQFRGARGDGMPVMATHPEKWSADEHLAWKTKLEGVGWSQPIVWGDKVFVTTAVAENQKRPRPGDWSPGEGVNIFSAISAQTVNRRTRTINGS